MSEQSDLFEFEYGLEASPEKVWRALTVPAFVAEWLLPGSFDVEKNESFTLDGKEAGLSETIDCTILDAEEPRRLSLSWREDAKGQRLESIVTFELERGADGGTLLRLRHTKLASVPIPANSNMPVLMALAA